MYLTYKQILTSAVFALASCVTAAQVNAQYATFNVPFEVHWGSTVLAPGTHKFSITPATSWPQPISLVVKDSTTSIFALLEATEPETDDSYLRIVNIGGTYFVREYYSGSAGKRFTFRVPGKGQTGHGEESQMRRIPVTNSSLN